MRVEDALAGLRRVLLDTAPVIYHVEGNVNYQAVTDAFFAAVQKGSVQAVTTPVTLAECLVHPLRRGDSDLADQFSKAITQGTNTDYVGIDEVAEKAAELRARHNLTLLDAFQVAAAVQSGCDALLTNDIMLKRVTEVRILVLNELET